MVHSDLVKVQAEPIHVLEQEIEGMSENEKRVAFKIDEM